MDITLYTYYRKQGNEDVFVRYFFLKKRVKHTNSRVAQFHKPDLEN